MYHIRSAEKFLEDSKNDPFVLISGPVQVGKTKIAQRYLQKSGGLYFSWDDASDREAIYQNKEIAHSRVVLDGFQSYDRWQIFSQSFDALDDSSKVQKVLLGNIRSEDAQVVASPVTHEAGEIDVLGEANPLTPTFENAASASLNSSNSDFVQKIFELLPFSVGEFESGTVPLPNLCLDPSTPSKYYDKLFDRSGFPEPLLGEVAGTHREWQLKQRDQFLKKVVSELTEIKMIHSVEHLMILLAQHVGTPLSVNALKDKLSIGFNTVKSWIKTLEELYYCFTLKPFQKGVSRPIKKEGKVYMLDWTLVEHPSARFENFVAAHLWKAVTYWKQCGYGNYDLSYIRDRSKREIDFCITLNGEPKLLIDAKLGDDHETDFLAISARRHSVAALQLLHQKNVHQKLGPVTKLSADQWLGRLP